MNDLKVIENELVPVYETSTGEKVVYGTELHEALEVKSKFADWVKNRLSDCDAQENQDFESISKILESGGRSIEYIIKLDTAKEMAMLERNDKGKEVRKYFIKVEKKYQSSVINLESLDPQTKLMNLLVQSISKNELEQKRQADEIKQLQETTDKQAQAISTVKQTFIDSATEEEFQKWVSRSINKVAESRNYTPSTMNKYQSARSESYQRLADKANCRLTALVQNAIRRAQDKGATRAQINAINKLTVIMADKRLKELYAVVIKEMMIAYCVDVA